MGAFSQQLRLAHSSCAHNHRTRASPDPRLDLGRCADTTRNLDCQSRFDDGFDDSAVVVLAARGVEVDDMQPLGACACEVHRDRRRVVRIDGPLIEVSTHEPDAVAVHDVDRGDHQHPTILIGRPAFWPTCSW